MTFFIIMNMVTFTVTAIFCFLFIKILKKKNDLERRHYKLLCITGIPSYILGSGVIVFAEYGDDSWGTVVIISAMLCFITLSQAFSVRWRQMSSREYTIMVLWGQAAFSLVILGLSGVEQLFS